MLSTFIAIALAAAAPPLENGSNTQRGLEGALRGCEEWILRPASWAKGPKPFIAAVGLGPKMDLVERVDDINLPPPALRVANHYWRINSTEGAGFVLVVSDRLPMCHITGGGNVDMQPVVSSLLSSDAFRRRWTATEDTVAGDLATTRFRNVEEPKFSLTPSRARRAGESLDRVQVLATAAYSTDK